MKPSELQASLEASEFAGLLARLRVEPSSLVQLRQTASDSHGLSSELVDQEPAADAMAPVSFPF